MLSQEALNISLVDDDPLFLSALKHEIEHVFSGRNIKVNSYDNSETFFHSLHDEQPKIVILDYDLNTVNRTSMNGDEILKLIKDNYPATEVIISSGVSASHIARDLLHNGALDYIQKDHQSFNRLDASLLNCIRLIELREERDRYKVAAYLMGLLIVFLMLVIFIN